MRGAETSPSGRIARRARAGCRACRGVRSCAAPATGGCMRRGLASWLALCAVLGPLGCAGSGDGKTPEAAAREQLVGRALAVLRERLDTSPDAQAVEIQRE